MKQVTFCEARFGYPRCIFEYEFQGIRVTRYLDISSLPEAALRAANRSTLNCILAHFGMAWLPRLFALDDFDLASVRPLWLSPNGVRFYESYIQRGLAELRLRNGLDLSRRVVIDIAPDAPRYEPRQYSPRRSALLLNGGGKDTAVAGEILRETGLPFTWFTLGQTRAMTRLIHLSGNTQAITFRQGGSLRLLRNQTRYEGHKPFTSLVAFAGLLAAFVQRHEYIVAANEYSANFGNLVRDGFQVNHQYPKSHHFETQFSQYVQTEILPGLKYFSILRPLYEIQIARLFSEYPQYLTAFRSCNSGHKADNWCLSCPKCAFILLALAPHLSQESLISIFGANAFAFPELRRWIVKLCGAGVRPFECVGTRRESLVALWMSHQRHPGDGFITSLYEECCAGRDFSGMERRYMGRIDRPHSIPPELTQSVINYLKAHLAPDPDDISAGYVAMVPA